MPKHRTPYPAEFRKRMVDLVKAGRTPEELAEDFEPTAQSIRNWVAQAARDEGARADAYDNAMCESFFAMRCDVCGNDYDKTFEVRQSGRTFTFDCLECAAQRIAPVCAHCGCRILGHGVEQEDRVFCCAHCARAEGKDEVRDRAEARA